MEMAPLERAGNAACRETGSRGTGWGSAGSAAPSELGVHRVAALGKGDEILPHHPNPLIPYNVPGGDGARLFQGEGGRLLLHLAWLGAVMGSMAHPCHSFQSDSSMCQRGWATPGCSQALRAESPHQAGMKSTSLAHVSRNLMPDCLRGLWPRSVLPSEEQSSVAMKRLFAGAHMIYGRA